MGTYLTLENGRELVFGLYMSSATYPELNDGLVQAGDDVAHVAAAFQQSLSKDEMTAREHESDRFLRSRAV